MKQSIVRISLVLGLLNIACLAVIAPTPTLTVTSMPTATLTGTSTPKIIPSPPPSAPPTQIPTSSPTLTPTASPTVSPTPTPFNSPTPTEAPTIPTATAMPQRPVPQVYETTLTIPTYGYENAFLETQPDDPVYPYPRLDPNQVTPPEPRNYKAIVLENEFVSLVILPELGGRIYRWVDKTTGRHLLYENPVIKPTQWGYRGWWLAAGGIEWAFPVEEHGLNEWRPWRYAITRNGSTASVAVSDTEDRTGMEVGVIISLDAEHSYMTLNPWARNNTAAAHPYQYWLNAMITLGDNHVSGETRLIIPAQQVIIHSTGDTSLPGGGQPMSWPLFGGRDLSYYGTWNSYLGFFVPHPALGFVAVYDEGNGQGIIRSFSPGNPAGTKFFGPGILPPSLWTDDDSTYLELWSGATPTFADYRTLEPGQAISWQEKWYPIHGIGGVQFANQFAALNLRASETEVMVGVATSTFLQATLTLWVGDAPAQTWALELSPGEAFVTSWSRQASAHGPLGLTLISAEGQPIAKMGETP